MEHRFNFIHILRAIAIVLITNSHFKPVYPPSWSLLASGGAVGCALFFFCSGYTLRNCSQSRFGSWILKRFSRIYIGVWLFLIVQALIMPQYPLRWQTMLWPPYWFLQAILCFYVPFYFVTKYLSARLPLCIGLLLVPLLLSYFFSAHSEWIIDKAHHPSYLHWYYYFGIMLLGTYCSQRNPTTEKASLPLYLAGTGVAFLLLYGLKYFCIKHPSYAGLQLLFPAGLVGTTLLFYRTSILLASRQILKSIRYIISQLADLTLEIYISQFLILLWAARLGFPWGLLATIGCTLLCAIVLHALSNRIYRTLWKIKTKQT